MTSAINTSDFTTSLTHGKARQADIERQVTNRLALDEQGNGNYVVLEWSGWVDRIYTTCAYLSDAQVNAGLAKHVARMDGLGVKTFRVWNRSLRCFE